ncbi:MAG: YraN family protein [Micropruina sp.]|nr:YraN family protein [Micropruina sp.]
MEKSAVGRAGEVAAVQHLVQQGWNIVERNWRCSLGEVDIIAQTPEPDPVLVFCEVKCRTGLGYGDPLEAITWRKLARLRQLALTWLGEQPQWVPRYRIDAIGVLLNRSGRPQVTHVEGVGE